MSDIRRFSPTIAEVKATAYCGEHPYGEYVLASDYDAAMRAKDAEIARLREALATSPCPRPFDGDGTQQECVNSGRCGCEARALLKETNDE
jgi:hypothetical protein